MTEKPCNVAVFITAYNEEAMIGDVLSGFEIPCDIYVIDDGSADRTAEIAEEMGARVISHPVNAGQGVALLTAFSFFLKQDYDIIIEMDGDGQHDPREIPKFLEKIQKTNADIVAGSRLLGTDYKGAPLPRRIFLSPLTWVLNKLTGYSLSDSMCGFRAFRLTALKKAERFLSDMSEPEYIASEMWIKFARAGLKVENVPITLSARKKGFSYKGMFKYGWRVIFTIINAKLDTYKYKY